MIAAVGETTRMLILHRLAEQPRNVGELAELIGIPMVNMSHHLGVMRQAGLLEDQKDGRKVVYKLRPDIYTPSGDMPNVIGTLQLGCYRLSIVKAEDGGKAKGKAAKKAE